MSPVRVISVLFFLFFRTAFVQAGRVTNGGCGVFGWLFQKIKLDIRNEIAPNTPLTIHCKSKDDDLGVHVLQYGGVQTIRFTAKFSGHTFFWCDVYWNGRHEVLDAYKGGEIDRGWFRNCMDLNCNCEWNLSANGPCYKKIGSTKNECFPWRPHPIE